MAECREFRGMSLPKSSNRAATSLALALALSLGAAAQAQEQDLSPVAVTLGRNLGLGKAGGNAAPASALRFSRQAAVARQVNQRLAKNLAQTMGQPGKAQNLQTLLDGGDLDEFTNRMRRLLMDWLLLDHL